MSAERENERRRVIYTGRVQGVGFRYTTAAIARRHAVTGLVRNLSDGTVELVAEGTGEALDRFLKEIDATFAGKIRERKSLPADSDEEFRRFEIRP